MSSDLFGGLPGFAGGPTPPDPAPTAGTFALGPAGPPEPAPAPAEEWEEWEGVRARGDVRAPAEFPIARPGQATTVWGAPERGDALWGPLAASDAVLGADPTDYRTIRDTE